MANNEQPGSWIGYAAMSLAGAVLASGIGYYVVNHLPELQRAGILSQAYFLVVSVFSVAIAAFIFGAMRSSAAVRGKQLPYSWQVRGPAAGVALVILAAFLLPSKPPITFDLAIQLYGPDQVSKMSRNASVNLDFGRRREHVAFSDSGEATVHGLDSSVRQMKLSPILESPDYQMTNPIPSQVGPDDVLRIGVERKKSPSSSAVSGAVPVAVSSLCALENALYDHASLVNGPAQFQKLSDYYVSANRSIFQQVDELLKKYDQHREQHGVMCLYAPAGEGKSFLLDAIAAMLQKRAYVISLDELAKTTDVMQASPDLQVNEGFQYTFSRMPTFKGGLQNFEQLLQYFSINFDKEPRPFILVDSLDELHPRSSEQVLHAIARFLGRITKRRTHNFIEVLVFGRPEGFYDFFVEPSAKDTFKLFDRYKIQAPVYKTQGDVELLVREYSKFKNRHLPDRTSDNVVHFCRFPFVLATLSNLADQNALIDLAAVRGDASEREIKKAVFDAKLHRDRLSHDRPDSDVDTYTVLLEDAAAKYADASNDSEGGFEASGGDTIKFEMAVGGALQKGKVTVPDLLSRSGMVFLDPADTLNYHFTFTPLWLQRYLVQRYNARSSATAGAFESCGP